jgi:tRNA/rRNA methyltransferase
MKISFILVEPALPENVGAAARAVKTMGFKELLLVNPCNYLEGPARWVAHASFDILEQARVFSSLRGAVAGFDFIIGTSAKKRRIKNDYCLLPGLNDILLSKGNAVYSVAIVFGREESGLRNDELMLCDLVTSIPMKTTFPSLNLAQAVMVYAWELSKLLPARAEESIPENRESFRVLSQKARAALIQLGFREESAIFNRFMERLSLLGEEDIHLLHSLCNKLLEKKK